VKNSDRKFFSALCRQKKKRKRTGGGGSKAHSFVVCHQPDQKRAVLILLQKSNKSVTIKGSVQSLALVKSAKVRFALCFCSYVVYLRICDCARYLG